MVVKKTTESSQTSGEDEKTRKKALVVAQEISFAKVLAGNDKKLRDRGVKRLRKWLSARSKSDCGKPVFSRIALNYCPSHLNVLISSYHFDRHLVIVPIYVGTY